MDKLIEITGRSEVLDALWFCDRLSVNSDTLSLRDMLGVSGEILDIGQLLFGKYRIVLIYDKMQYGLHQKFMSDAYVAKYINSYTEEAFKEAVRPYKPYIYVLNIASVENFGAFSWDKAGDLLHKQLTIYMPIIQKFMVDALTDTLCIMEDSKLV